MRAAHTTEGLQYYITMAELKEHILAQACMGGRDGGLGVVLVFVVCL